MVDQRGRRTEVKPEVVFLGRLVEQVVAGKIRVPLFQRPFVWKQDDLHQLLDSVLRGFPIGSILVWDSEQRLATTARVGPVQVGAPPVGVAGYLLDGQQRVSTLVGVLRLSADGDSKIDSVDWRIACDLETLQFFRMPEDELAPQYFPVRSLLDTAGFFTACREIETRAGNLDKARRWIGEADRLASAFRDYQLPVIRISDADLDSAVAVFARLNRTGRKMAADEMVSALTYQEGEFHLAKEFDDFKDKLAGKGFGNLDRVFLLRSVLAALGRDIYAKDWASLMVQESVREQLPDIFEDAAGGISQALVFLGQLGVSSDRLLPYGLQLVLLGEFFRLCPEPCTQVADLLKRWFWVTSFTGWFGGVNTAQATHALAEMRRLARGEVDAIKVLDLDTAAQPFPERFDGRSARVRAFLLFLASLKPLSVQTLKELNPGHLLTTRGTRTMGYVSSNSASLQGLFSSPANRMYTGEGHVGQAITSLEALDDRHLRQILPTHGFPLECVQHVRSGDRASLVGARLERLIADERNFMAQWNVTLPSSQTGKSIADSDASQDE